MSKSRLCAAILATCLCFSLFAVPVSNETDLQNNIVLANAGSVSTITFTNPITYAQTFRPLNATPTFDFAGRTFTIDGQSNTLSTTGNFRGFFVRGGGASVVTIQNLTISGARAKGGDSNARAGGGAGLGGGHDNL